LFRKREFSRRPARAPALCTRGAARTIQVRGLLMNEKLLAELSARLAALAAANPAKDLEKNFRGMLSSTFAKLDLVTREEYDVQSRVLARAKEKLATLEARIAELEKRRG
jgi:BMFP domain-containing protein YqiC